MKIPERNLEHFAQELIDECTISKSHRAMETSYWERYYYTGSADETPALYNRCYSHIDRTASYLFSPADVRFKLECDSTVGKNYLDRAAVASRYLSREFHRAGVDTQFGFANELALRKGCAILKINWGHNGFDPDIVHPECFGVLREDITSLDKQEAFVHTTYLTRSQFARLLEDNPRKDELMEAVKKKASRIKKEQEADSYMNQLVIGGTHPISTTGSSNGSVSSANISPIPSPLVSAEIRQNLIRLHELWVIDSERGDYRTIQMVEPGIIITGKYKSENVCGVKGDHPFRKVCPNEIDGYFWGRSELAIVKTLQDMLNRRTDEYDMLSQMRANPSRAYTGFNGITDEVNSMINSPGGYITESQGSGGKVENLAPAMPQDIFQGINEIIQWFDDCAGFENIMKGQGESGVRAGVHADTLMRSAGNRLRDRALLVERQLGDVGDFCFRLQQNKIADIFSTEADSVSNAKTFTQWMKAFLNYQPENEPTQFTLDQFPEDYKVSVDSHSASPAFSEDANRMAIELAKLHAIDDIGVLEMMQPPNADMLIASAKQRKAEQAAMIQAHPELLEQKGKSKKK